MTCEEIIIKLQSKASKKHKANVIRMGIPEDYSIGVSTTIIRNIAKEIEKSNELAYKLWKTGYHEARLLAVLIFERNNLNTEDIEYLMNDVISWDLCDHLCKNLIIKLPNYDNYIIEWISSSQIYKKRAAFVLIASSVIHDKNIADNKLDDYLQLIFKYSHDNHEHIKKAISWALREIGKKDFNYNEKALLLAHEFIDHGDKVQVWIGRNAIKELENVTKVADRERLISTNTKTGSRF
ncbi:DNA alkylation repair protein [Sporanaerobacter acetigenes]|uniref:DNA alkylation repair protein n=1 Tax=Sporanaerobacter acetigenes TaxID=165813 RepID=UPI00104FD8B5|nr:DNA alkylation repair protein [Sporanaerobacter acetigenes]